MAHSEIFGDTTLKFSCACCQVNGSINIPSIALPLPINLCHCDSCRHSTGQLCASIASLPKESTSLQIRGRLKGYELSAHGTRCFCEQCGAFIYDRTKDQGVVGIHTGVLDEPEGLVKLKQHENVADTKDGGLSAWLPNTAMWEAQPHKSQPIRDTPKAKPNFLMIDKVKLNPNLQCHCSCGGVQFYITSPCQQSAEISSPWPDLLVPYHSASSENPEDVKWWLREKGTKYLAGTCACNSCRLASGSDIQAWAFVPRNNIHQPGGQSLDFTMGTLKQYSSSEGVFREFCNTCGATVFWHCDERPNLIDVSVGLLSAECGSRAESWLSWWTERVSFEEDANNKALVSSLSAGLKEWAAWKTAVRVEIDL